MTAARHILVTGGAGFIGSHTCKRLDRSGFVPVVYDNLSTGHEDNVKWGPLVKGDLLDRELLRQTIDTWRPECVIHFAASAYVGESMASPRKYYGNNVATMIALLDCCLDGGVSKIVFSSSCATYGIPAVLPITEETAQQPINPYGRTKLIGEFMLRDYAAAYGLCFAALRYFNAAGADLEGELSERHDPETHLIPRAMMAASGSIDRLDVFGHDYDTPDGTCIRDYIHVNDLAAAHVEAVKHLVGGGDSIIVNLGSGRGTSIMEIADAVARITGRSVPIHYAARRPGDPAVLCADISKAKTLLNFEPRYSDIETIVRTAAPGFGLLTNRKDIVQ